MAGQGFDVGADELERARRAAEHALREWSRMENEAEDAHRRIQQLERELRAAKAEAGRWETEADEAHVRLQRLETAESDMGASRKRIVELEARVHELEAALRAERAETAALRDELQDSPMHAPAPSRRPVPAPPADLEPEEERTAVVEAAAERVEPGTPPPRADPSKPRPRVPVWADPTPINVNTAQIEDLLLLPGIGRKPAERILAFREERGGLSSIDELYEIPDFPKERLARIWPHIGV